MSLRDVQREQAQSNRNVDQWHDEYRAHRDRTTAAIADLAPAAPGRLCLLGAGNCRDVDLEALADRFSELHLVDIDPDALARAQQRQPEAVRAKLHRHAPVDLTGILDRATGWKKQPPTLAEMDRAIEEGVERITIALPGPFDVVASCCLITQLSRATTASLGEDNPLWPEIWERVAAIHMRSLAALLAPGGQALLISDLVSNDTYPLDELEADADLAELIPELLASDNFLIGADPSRVSRLLRRDPVLSTQAGPANRLPPWLWNAGGDLTFLIYAVSFERH